MHARTRGNARTTTTMLRRGLPHQRRFYSKPQIGARTKLVPRVTFRNFLYFVLALLTLAFTPSVYQRFFQVDVRMDCEWLKNPPMVCAHGGDSSRAPPNTCVAKTVLELGVMHILKTCDPSAQAMKLILNPSWKQHAAYQLAIDAGADCIEIDASRTWDGVLLALHDRDLKKMSERSSIRVGDLTANQISKLDPAIGFSGTFPDQHVPTVEDAIKYVQQSLKQIIIDAKVGPPLFEERLPADLIFVVKKTECRGCVIWAKDDKLIREIIRRSTTTKTGYIVMNDTATGKISDLVRFDGAEVVGVYYGLINSKLVKFLHRAGRRAYAWTVNSHDTMIEMLKAGVDAIITNDPQLLQLVIRDQKRVCNGFTAF